MSEVAEKRSRRGGGRDARRTLRSGGATQLSTPYLVRHVPLYEMLSDEGAEIIENNAETILEEIGIEFKDDPEALDILREHGADVQGQRVHFPRGLCREYCQKAPSEFTQHARNPARSVEIGGNRTVFAPVYGPPFIRDLDNERRYATIEDFRNLVKLIYMLPGLHHSGGTVCEPVDLPVPKRHLEMLYTHMKYSDKPFMGSVTAASRAQDTVDMAKVLFGDGFLDENNVLVSLINANSPMTWDDTMLGALKVYARHGQAVIISPFILAGAMSPVSVAGTLAQTLAEAMSGIAFAQMVRPGAPVIFGSFASSMSMQTGAPTFGTPEPALVLNGCAKLARRLGVPFRSGGSLTAAKTVDAQAAYESTHTIMPSVTSGVNFVLHSAGWMEGGLVSDFRKLLLDADQLTMMQRMVGGIDLSENGQAMDAIRETGPGQHFLGSSHTQANFEDAFWRSDLADYTTFEQWSSEGAVESAKRAENRARTMLNNYEAPAIDPAIDEALIAFKAKRMEELPDSEY
ncbi:trimethylamine methyltransferase family protein [Alphaproteobacteria bacterium]|nr:trimethylamine methyltransferase family protein [Alphaproteobacteria bacterium]MDG2466291.1 trimethylamine methyltransferase family protein [Alphaproteobacteria bacterium]